MPAPAPCGSEHSGARRRHHKLGGAERAARDVRAAVVGASAAADQASASPARSGRRWSRASRRVRAGASQPLIQSGSGHILRSLRAAVTYCDWPSSSATRVGAIARVDARRDVGPRPWFCDQRSTTPAGGRSDWKRSPSSGDPGPARPGTEGLLVLELLRGRARIGPGDQPLPDPPATKEQPKRPRVRRKVDPEPTPPLFEADGV